MRRLTLLLLPLGLASCELFSPKPTPRYEVFFDERSTQLSAAAYGIIAEAASPARAMPTLPVHVTGYTDTKGSVSADDILSRDRADVVARALRANGVPAARLQPEAYGQTSIHPEEGRRRVEIIVGP